MDICGLKKVFLLGQRYSYQITFDTQSEDEDEWRPIAYYRENGEKKSCDIRVKEDTWSQTFEMIGELELEECREVSSSEGTFVRLYYSDETSRQVKPDQQTMKELEAFFVELLEELQGK